MKSRLFIVAASFVAISWGFLVAAEKRPVGLPKSNTMRLRAETARKKAISFIEAWTKGDWGGVRGTLSSKVTIDEQYWSNITVKKPRLVLPDSWQTKCLTSLIYSPFETRDVAYLELKIPSGETFLNYFVILARDHTTQHDWGILFFHPSPMAEQFSLWMQDASLIPYTEAANKPRK